MITVTARKKFVNWKIRQAANNEGALGGLPYKVISRAVKDIGTDNEDNDFWVDGRLDEWTGYGELSSDYVVRLLRENNLIARA